MRNIIAFLLLSLTSVTVARAQKVLLEQDVARDTIKSSFGQNLKYFGHFYGGFGLAASAAEAKSSAVEYPASHEFVFGYRFKYRVGQVYALGFETSVSSQTFKIKQQSGKTLPTTMLFDEEKFRFTNLGLGVYQRFNWGKRGNHVGKFIDLGVFGNWMPVKVHIYEDDNIFGVAGPLSGVKMVKVRETGLKYIADTNYGVNARLGFNRYVFYANYRLSDFFNTGYAYMQEGVNVFDFAELPRLSVGFQIGFH